VFPYFFTALEQLSNHKHDLFHLLAQLWTCRWTWQNWSVFVTCSFFNAWCSFERKSNGEDRKAINMKNLELLKDFKSLQNEKQVW